MSSFVLSSENSKEFAPLFKKGTSLVFYHANWCGHCIGFQDEWKKTVALIKKNKLPIQIIDVEHSTMPLLPASLQKIRGFPSLILFKNGKPDTEYQGERKATAIVSFLKGASKQ